MLKGINNDYVIINQWQTRYWMPAIGLMGIGVDD